MSDLRIGIIGAGLIGKKRAAALKGGKLIAVADKIPERASDLAHPYGAASEKSCDALIARKDLDAVIIATSNDAIAGFSIAALESGKHVLVEKPAGRNPEDLAKQVEAARDYGKILRVGFNHRFHPAFQKARQMLRDGAVGELMYLRARYGHGGRVGYDREWRADPKIGGGGELLDQGIHLIDLCRWLGGEFDLEWGNVGTYFWEMPVEDNGFLFLRAPGGKTSAFLHASCTEWKNLFDFEIFGKTGKLEIAGLGRSYGVEELKYFKMKPEMGPPDFQSWSFPGDDLSWQLEFDAFRAEIEGASTDIGRIEDAAKAVEIVYQAYRQSKVGWA